MKWALQVGRRLSAAATDVQGDYRRIPLSVAEIGTLLSTVHPNCPPLATLLSGWGVAMRGKTADLYMLDEGAAPGVSSGPHSDRGPVVFLQLVGVKRLRIGGVHLTPPGSAGQTIFLDGDESAHFVQTATQIEIAPNNAAGFATRQTHELTVVTVPNLSLSVSVQPM